MGVKMTLICPDGNEAKRVLKQVKRSSFSNFASAECWQVDSIRLYSAFVGEHIQVALPTGPISEP
jgi:hypothetical protein